ncbi:hypothetical protein RFF05_04295 [Bengtsoniella intestinalis]|uniref:hypothetical protein n=1 Tax=Bengtsoniella intestinalis TaxID=3073143 RepID=UPI00391EE895
MVGRPRDWELLDTQAVVDVVLSTVEPNDIILLHDTYATSVEAALQLIDEMTAMGYRFVTVEELLAINEIEVEDSVIYRSATGYSDSIWYGSDYVED